MATRPAHPPSPGLRLAVLVTAVVLSIGSACASGGSTSSGEPASDQGLGGDQGAAGDSSAAGGDTSSTPGAGGKTAGFPTGAGVGGSGGATGGNGGAKGGASGSGGTASGGAPGAPFGTVCTMNTDCASDKCVDIGKTGTVSKVCVVDCKTGTPCPKDAHCTVIGSTPECIPDRADACAVCNGDGDCKNVNDVCATGTDGERYCAQDCSQDGACPTGLTCQSVTVSGKMLKACAPASSAPCPCAQNRDGAARPCTKMMGAVTCNGVETCDGKSGMFVGCTAPSPMPETCNGKDDDCNGKVDDLPNTMCSCMPNGMCTAMCAAGFAHYPGTAVGCTCPVDAKQGNTCAAARDLGTLTDSGGMTEVTAMGTLASDTEVDWFHVAINDTMEAGTNSYHVKISFDMNPGMEFVLVAARGGDCTKEPVLTPVTTYEFCVNYRDDAGMKGEAPCGLADGLAHCEDLSSPYVIGVKRAAAAAMKTCSPYQLHVAAAAGPCMPATLDACTM